MGDGGTARICRRVEKKAVYDTIALSEAFYDEVNQHPIPAERRVVASLANAPGLLDFYVWIVWKSWTLKSDPPNYTC